MMKGRPILGVIGGFMFGLFGGLTLFLYGVIPLQSDLLWILPLVGIVVGLVFAAWAPFGGRSSDSPEAPTQEDVSEQPKASAPAAEAEVEEKPDDTIVDVEVHEQGGDQPEQ